MQHSVALLAWCDSGPANTTVCCGRRACCRFCQHTSRHQIDCGWPTRAQKISPAQIRTSLPHSASLGHGESQIRASSLVIFYFDFPGCHPNLALPALAAWWASCHHSTMDSPGNVARQPSIQVILKRTSHQTRKRLPLPHTGGLADGRSAFSYVILCHDTQDGVH
jgi:hypothetical protein